MVSGLLFFVISTGAFAQDVNDAALKSELDALEAGTSPPCEVQYCETFEEKIGSGNKEAAALLHRIWSLLEAYCPVVGGSGIAERDRERACTVGTV
jgi:hypothetical protein